jgi:hypothetical protein
MFRSLNSLLEKFHQSFFFYLLPSTSRYVSIGLYMPPLGCVMIGPILAAVSCWISSVQEKGKKIRLFVHVFNMYNVSIFWCTRYLTVGSSVGTDNKLLRHDRFATAYLCII